MHEALLIGVGLALAALVVGALLRRYSLHLGLTFQVFSAALARLLGAAACGWTAAQLLEQPAPLRVVGAIAVSLLALWFVLSAGIVLYALVDELRQRPKTEAP